MFTLLDTLFYRA